MWQGKAGNQDGRSNKEPRDTDSVVIHRRLTSPNDDETRRVNTADPGSDKSVLSEKEQATDDGPEPPFTDAAAFSEVTAEAARPAGTKANTGADERKGENSHAAERLEIAQLEHAASLRPTNPAINDAVTTAMLQFLKVVEATDDKDGSSQVG